MPGLVFGAIVPHGDIIPALNSESIPSAELTNLAMQEVAVAYRQAAPDVLLVLTPHGVRVEASVTVSITERTSGQLSGNDATIGVDLPVHQLFALTLATKARAAGVPVSPIIFGSAAGQGSVLPLDWGAIIPLWYLLGTQPNEQKVVIAVPSRSVGADLLYNFGRAAAQAASDANLTLGVIASADWSHTHSVSGPYGYSAAAKELDRLVVTAVENNDLRSMGRFSDKLIEDAKPDGIWQALILAGALDTTNLKVRLISYEVPSYFGMLTAVFEAGESYAADSNSGPS